MAALRGAAATLRHAPNNGTAGGYPRRNNYTDGREGGKRASDLKEVWGENEIFRGHRKLEKPHEGERAENPQNVEASSEVQGE